MGKIYLIVATVGRVKPLFNLLRSVAQQGVRSQVQIVLVDQNEDTRLSEVVESFWGTLDILWIGSRLGLSRARNIGLSLIDGEGVVGFPDDDCEYPAGFLRGLLGEFGAREVEFLSVRETAPDGGTDTRPLRSGGAINHYNVWRACGSNRTFYTIGAVRAIGDFDDELGLGAGTVWEGGEDIDYPARALTKGLCGWFSPSLHVLHAGSVDRGRGLGANRGFGYNAAMGRIWKRHGYRRWWVLYQVLRALGGILTALGRCDAAVARHHWDALRGRIWGWYHA